MTNPDRPARVLRARFSEHEPLAERLVHMITALATELAVTHERLDTLERILEKSNVLDAGAIDAFIADGATEAARRGWRERFLDQVFEALQAEIDAATAAIEADQNE